jgi:gamma-glutamyltranspeptidase/glutathione hydrolase
VAIVAADADGHWVCIIQSLFHAFGSGILDPATGVLLHNRGAAFSLVPGTPGELAGGRRPPHTLMPVLVRDSSGHLVAAHGTMGGRAQPQIHTHLALHLALGRTPAEAVSAPRWIVGQMEAGAPAPSVVLVEEPVPAAAQSALATLGLRTQLLPANDDGVGHAQVVRRTVGAWHRDAGTLPGLNAASDPRADGLALVLES